MSSGETVWLIHVLLVVFGRTMEVYGTEESELATKAILLSKL